MPTFDIFSEIDNQEVKNAVDQAIRESGTRFDFKGTDSTISLGDTEITLESASEDRLAALVQLLEEKLVKRHVSLKALDKGKVIEATKGRARQIIKLRAGIDQDNAKKINSHIKGIGIKGVSSSTQGDRLRVTGKKRDDLQSVITSLKESDFGIPIDFGNFRD